MKDTNYTPKKLVQLMGAATRRFSRGVCLGLITAGAVTTASLQAQTGPFPDDTWPTTINSNAVVDYGIFDPNATFSTTPSGWNNTILSFGGGGDEDMVPVTFAGLMGDEAQDAFANPADANWSVFESMPVLDILLQVWGNGSFDNANGTPKSVQFLEGPAVTSPNGLFTSPNAPLPAGLDNSAWNWLLLEVTNAIDPDDGNRYVGDPNATTPYGGINGGTIRIQNIGPGLTIRAIAIGPQGAFGTSNQINVFAAPPVCPPEPPVNLVYIDFNQKITNDLTIISNAADGYTYIEQSGVGPAGDQRTAVQSTSGVMDFGILSNYLGQPCNAPGPMKFGIDFYDDPALAGTTIAPGTYSTDAEGDTTTFSGTPYTLLGSGQWVKVGLWANGVSLFGVNTAPLTGGPTLVITGTAPFIDRVELGIARSGTNALAGLDPAPSYLLDPLVCDTNYGYYAEWDPQDGVTNNVDVGSSGGDQNMVVELAGPTNDQRIAEAPAPGSGNNNIQFALLNNVFGPDYQDNADVAIQLTYYDDPALRGAQVYPQVYTTLQYGSPQIIPPPAPYNQRATLQGTGKWVTAYFELPNVNFAGVNQGPQSVVRFETAPATNNEPDSGDVFISRVQFNVIRPCGPFEGINMLQTLTAQVTNQTVNVNWFGTGTLQSSANVAGPYTNVLSTQDIVTNSYATGSNSAQFFKLQFPAYPAYLNTNTP